MYNETNYSTCKNPNFFPGWRRKIDPMYWHEALTTTMTSWLLLPFLRQNPPRFEWENWLDALTRSLDNDFCCLSSEARKRPDFVPGTLWKPDLCSGGGNRLLLSDKTILQELLFRSGKGIRCKLLPMWKTWDNRFPVSDCGLITIFNTIK